MYGSLCSSRAGRWREHSSRGAEQRGAFHGKRIMEGPPPTSMDGADITRQDGTTEWTDGIGERGGNAAEPSPMDFEFATLYV